MNFANFRSKIEFLDFSMNFANLVVKKWILPIEIVDLSTSWPPAGPVLPRPWMTLKGENKVYFPIYEHFTLKYYSALGLMYIWQLFRIFLTSFHHILVMQQHRIDKKNNWFFTLLQQPQTIKCQKSKKKAVRLKKQIWTRISVFSGWSQPIPTHRSLK